jgi:hypothetical protein
MSDRHQTKDSSIPEVTILPRPQISIFLTEGGEICISTAGISQDFENVEMSDVYIPVDAAQEVSQALLSIAQATHK